MTNTKYQFQKIKVNERIKRINLTLMKRLFFELKDCNSPFSDLTQNLISQFACDEYKVT
jgi:hypothetical protein